MLIADSFPNIYICQDLNITGYGVPFNIAANSLVSFPISVSSLASPAPLILSATDTVFVHAFTYAAIVSTNSTLDNYYQMNFLFKVLNTTHFSIEMHVKYRLRVK